MYSDFSTYSLLHRPPWHGWKGRAPKAREQRNKSGQYTLLDQNPNDPMLSPMGSTVSSEPYLIQDSKFVRLAQRRGYGLIHLTKIALGFHRGIDLQVLAHQTNTSRATLRWLQGFPWQAALVIPPVPGKGPLTASDMASIRQLRALRVGVSDIAAYLRLPKALVTGYLRQRDDLEGAPDAQTMSSAAG